MTARITGVLLIPANKELLRGHPTLGGGPPTAIKLPHGRWIGSATIKHHHPAVDLDDLPEAIALGWRGEVVNTGVDDDRSTLKTWVGLILSSDMGAINWSDFYLATHRLGTFVYLDSEGRAMPPSITTVGDALFGCLGAAMGLIGDLVLEKDDGRVWRLHENDVPVRLFVGPDRACDSPAVVVPGLPEGEDLIAALRAILEVVG